MGQACTLGEAHRFARHDPSRWCRAHLAVAEQLDVVRIRVLFYRVTFMDIFFSEFLVYR
jgi:hypothetical protein